MNSSLLKPVQISYATDGLFYMLLHEEHSTLLISSSHKLRCSQNYDYVIKF